MRAGWGAAAGGAIGVWLAAQGGLAGLFSGDLAVLLGSGIGATVGAALGSDHQDDRMKAMADSMDAMFLGALAGGLATRLSLSSGVHHMTIMDGLMGGRIGGGASAWWPSYRGYLGLSSG